MSLQLDLSQSLQQIREKKLTDINSYLVSLTLEINLSIENIVSTEILTRVDCWSPSRQDETRDECLQTMKRLMLGLQFITHR